MWRGDQIRGGMYWVQRGWRGCGDVCCCCGYLKVEFGGIYIHTCISHPLSPPPYTHTYVHTWQSIAPVGWYWQDVLYCIIFYIMNQSRGHRHMLESAVDLDDLNLHRKGISSHFISSSSRLNFQHSIFNFCMLCKVFLS